MKTQSLTAKAKILIRRKPEEVFSAIVNAEVMSKYWFIRRDGGQKKANPLPGFWGAREMPIHLKFRLKN